MSVIRLHNFHVQRFKKDCREIVYKDSSERRRSKTYIGFVFSNFTIEADFAEVDPTWTGTDKESDESVEARVQAVLDKIFITEPKENICEYS